MGKPLMLQAADDREIELLKRKLGAKSKVDVVRAGLALLQQEVERQERVRRWQRAVALVRKTSGAVNRDFQKHSRLKRTP